MASHRGPATQATNYEFQLSRHATQKRRYNEQLGGENWVPSPEASPLLEAVHEFEAPPPLSADQLRAQQLQAMQTRGAPPENSAHFKRVQARIADSEKPLAAATTVRSFEVYTPDPVPNTMPTTSTMSDAGFFKTKQNSFGTMILEGSSPHKPPLVQQQREKTACCCVQ